MGSNRKAINIENMDDIKEIQNQMENAGMEIIPSSESLNKALEESKERYKMIDAFNRQREEKLVKDYGIKPMECHNGMCPYQMYDKYNFCSESHEQFLDCNCRMMKSRPNYLYYDLEYLPTWQECLDLLSKNGLLKEDTREECKKASLYYGKCTTQEERWNTEIKGVTMNQAMTAIDKTITEYLGLIKDDFDSEEERDKFYSHIDTNVIAKNSVLEFEKIMGIYPNINIR